MPIYEFKCVICSEYIELLLMNTEDVVNLSCKKCGSKNLERIISVPSHSISKDSTIGPNKKSSSASKETRSCSSGSCTTYNIPGPV